MLSILFGNHPDLFGALCRFYKPPPGAILDLTYGAGKLYDKGSHDGYKVLGVDLDPNTDRSTKLQLGHEVYQHDLCDLEHVPFQTHSGPVDIMVYDPPYLYGKTGTIFANDRDWKVTRTGEVNWAPHQQLNLARHVNRLVPEVLKPDGILIVKISDTHLNRELVMNHVIVSSQMTNCKLKDLLVYIRQNSGFFKRPKTAQLSHGYYMIFERRDTK